MEIESRYVKPFVHQDITEKVLNTCGIESQSIHFDSISDLTQKMCEMGPKQLANYVMSNNLDVL